MHYYNAKSKVIMKGEIVTPVFRGLGATEIAPQLGGASRRVRRSRSRRGGGKRPFIKRTCRSKSRCGGAANYRFHSIINLM